MNLALDWNAIEGGSEAHSFLNDHTINIMLFNVIEIAIILLCNVYTTYAA